MARSDEKRMTMMQFRQVRCSVCGTEHGLLQITNTFAFGSPDLDLRPPPAERDLLPYTIQQCRICGYVARDLSEPCSVPDFLRSFRYRYADFLPLRGLLARDYYKAYLIAREEGKSAEEQLSYLLPAIWRCDDLHETCSAIICRRKAARLLGQDDDMSVEKCLQRIDLLRRGRMFRQAIKACASLNVESPLYRQILRFQIRCARKRDDRCYTVEDALGHP